jgi:medium-chain acyl-[acyl-carrier-protein] hydrolase
MASPNSEAWFYCRREVRAPAVRLYCFGHAGAGNSAFFAWPDELPAEIEVHAAQFPGRERRRSESPFTDLAKVKGALAGHICRGFGVPFALYGHSLGSLIAFEVARELRRRGAPAPVHLMAGAIAAPQIRRFRPAVSQLPAEELLTQIEQRYGGLPEVIRRDAELRAMFVPILRADFTILDNYIYRDEPPLDCPITAYGGAGDLTISAEELDGWREQSNCTFVRRMFAGGHFFPQTHRAELLQDLSARLLHGAAHQCGSSSNSSLADS